MRITRLVPAVFSMVISASLLAGVAQAQTGSRRAPVIHLNTALGGSVATNYIEPTISLGEDAYAFVLLVDLDGRVSVLHPDAPDLSIRMTSGRQLYLPRFFAGFADDRFVSRAGSGYAEFDALGSGDTDTRGTMIGLASRRPFNLAAITLGGDWDLDALSEIVRNRDPHAAASVLARYLGARGEPIGRDVHRFAGGRHRYNTSYASRSYYECAAYYGSVGFARGFTSGYGISFFRAAQLREAGHVVRYLGIDACGQPRFMVYPQSVAGQPPTRPPAAGAFPQRRLPAPVPRNPTREPVTGGSTVLGSRPANPERYTERPVPGTPPARVAEPGTTEKFRPHPPTGTVYERPRVPAETPRSQPRAPERIAQPVYVPERIAAPRFDPPPPPPPAQVERERPAPPPDAKPVDG